MYLIIMLFYFFIVTICGTCNLVPVYAILADNDKGLDV